MHVTALTLKDCAKAAHLHRVCFYKGWTKKDFQDFLRNPLVFGLKIQKGDTFCGYILWREIDHEAEILTLVIAPPLQQKGLGNHLLKALFQYLKTKGMCNLFLEVAEDNETAQSFYLRNGITLLGKRPKYYKRPENKLVDALNFIKVIE